MVVVINTSNSDDNCNSDSKSNNDSDSDNDFDSLRESNCCSNSNWNRKSYNISTSSSNHIVHDFFC